MKKLILSKINKLQRKDKRTVGASGFGWRLTTALTDNDWLYTASVVLNSDALLSSDKIFTICRGGFLNKNQALHFSYLCKWQAEKVAKTLEKRVFVSDIENFCTKISSWWCWSRLAGEYAYACTQLVHVLTMLSNGQDWNIYQEHLNFLSTILTGDTSSREKFYKEVLEEIKKETDTK